MFLPYYSILSIFWYLYNSQATCIYTQSRWITLGPSVSPRLLARILAGPFLYSNIIFFLYLLYLQLGFLVIRNLTGSNFRSLSKIPHCCPIKEGSGIISTPLWRYMLPHPLKIVGFVSFYHNKIPNLWKEYLIASLHFFIIFFIIIIFSSMAIFNFFFYTHLYAIKNNLYFLINLHVLYWYTSIHSEPGSNP